MKEKTNLEILHDTFVKYCYDIPYIRYTMMPVLMSTILACYLEVKASVVSKDIVECIQNNKNMGGNVLLFIMYYGFSIILKQVNEIVFSGPIQFVYKVVGVEAFFHYICLDLDTFNNVGSGEIQQIIERKSRAYGDILELTTLSAVPTLITLIISFYSIYINLGSHALFVMIITGTIYVILTFIFSVWRTKVRRAYNKSQDISSNKLQDFLANHVTIKSYNTEENTIQYYDETQKSVEYYGIKSHRILYGMFYLQKLIFSFQAIIIIALGCYGFFPIKLNPQQLVFYISISKTLTSSLNEMGMLYNRYVQGFLNAKSGYFEFKEPDQSGLLRVAKFEKQIEFKNITFSYNNNNILKNTSFLINKNEKVAIIGKNGTGKSTIIKILMKFYNYDGQILLDNNDIQIIADRVYRSIIAYATQNTFLFNNTVSYNIKYGNKQISNEKILEYSKKMGIFEHIQELDNKFDTYVGERGRLLPGGERQKIMLMRSLLKTSQILLMDEPTSALDRSSESEIIEFILNEYENKTILMIVHNLDLLRLFDKVLFVNNKKIEVIEDVKNKILQNNNYFKNLINC